MKIIEALKELPLIDKKVQKAISKIQDYSSVVHDSRVELPFKTPEDQQKIINALIQSVNDNIARKAEIKRALSITNAETSVTIQGNKEGMTKTISEWISYRESGIDYLIRAQASLNDQTAQSQLQRTPVDTNAEIKALKFFDQKSRDEEILNLEEILGKIDSQLEVVNATTDLKGI